MIKKLLILVAWALVGVVVGMVLAMTGIAVFTDMTFGEFVRLLVSLNPGEVFAAALSGVALMKAGRLIDLEQWDDAYREHAMLYGHKEEIMPLYVREIECELLFLALVTGRMAQARELYGSDSLRSYIGNYRRIMSSKERLLFAVALFMEEDHGKAAGILDQVGSHRNDYLMQGEVKSDLAIMESLLANVKNGMGNHNVSVV